MEKELLDEAIQMINPNDMTRRKRLLELGKRRKTERCMWENSVSAANQLRASTSLRKGLAGRKSTALAKLRGVSVHYSRLEQQGIDSRLGSRSLAWVVG